VSHDDDNVHAELRGYKGGPLRRVLLILWAVFAALVIYTLTVASFFVGEKIPANIWIPQPWMLLVFSLMLILWTVGLFLTIAVREVAKRVRH